ncbi:hypothetical protein HYS48_01920 [Candidatus Woesearchaeota archaeon]|nr:hypothetical protein [Candidatus Woesearchaeota archaeon]
MVPQSREEGRVQKSLEMLCKTLEKESPTLLQQAEKGIAYVLIGRYFPTAWQEAYAERANIPDTRMFWCSIACDFVFQTAKAGVVYYAHRNTGATALVVESTLFLSLLYSLAHDGSRAMYTCITGRPIASLLIEIPYRSGKKVVQKVSDVLHMYMARRASAQES